MKFINNSLTHVGKVRRVNEDNMGDAQTVNGSLFIICDGMGGHIGGAQASDIAVRSILEFFNRQLYDNAIQAIDHALIFANEQIYASAVANPELKGMGTTAVILLIRDEDCFIGHVGDSRIYLRSNGKLNRITKDHSFVQNLVDSGIINDEDAESHPNKNQILQALGISPVVKATICHEAILVKQGDLFLLCSDGLNGMVTDKDIEAIMQEDNLSITSSNLIAAALNGGGKDNITASLVLIEESAHKNSRFVEFNPKSKIIEMNSTQQFTASKTVSDGKKLRMKLIIFSSILLIIVAIVVFMMTKKNAPSTAVTAAKAPLTHKNLYTKSDLQVLPCLEIKNLKGKRADFKEDTVINKKCNYQITIIDSVITNIDSIDINGKKTSNNSIKNINEMTEKEIEVLVINSKTTYADGNYKRHGYRIDVKDQVIIKKEKVNKKN